MDQDELMIISEHGVVIRCPISGVSVIGRATQGVKMMNLEKGDRVVDVARVVTDDAEQSGPSV